MEHEDEDMQASAMETTVSGSRFPEGKMNPIGERSRKDAEVAPAPQIDFTLPNALFPLRGMLAQYGADLRKTIYNHQDGVLNILREESSNEENSTVRASWYKELRRTTYPIMTDLSHLIMHLGGDEKTHADLTNLADQAEKEALLLFTSSAAPEVLPPRAILGNPSGVGEEEYPPHASDNVFPMLPHTKPKTSLKPSKFFPVFAEQTPPCITDYTNEGDEDEDEEPGLYSKLDKGVGDGTHYITASFVKTNEKIKDQLLTQVKNFLELMSANIDGVKFHPLSTDRSLPILTSSVDKNFPTTGTKIRNYFLIQNKYSLVPGTRNKPKVPPRKVDADGRFQFDENRVFDGPDKITGIMLISVPCNVKQAISNLLIELEGDVHQI